MPLTLKDPFLHELISSWPPLQSLLQTISPHVPLQLLLMSLQRRSGVRVRKDVSRDEIFAVGTVLETLFEAVGDLLAFEVVLSSLESSVFRMTDG